MAAASLVAVGTLGVLASGLRSNTQQADAAHERYKSSPVVLACTDKMTNTPTPVRVADVRAIPDAIARAKSTFSCPEPRQQTHGKNATVTCTGGDNGSVTILRSETGRIAAARSAGLACS